MNKFLRNLITEWRKLELPFANEKIIVAVSGGADSVGLLLGLAELKRLKKINLDFVVAHFNHKLRAAESDADEKFVKNLAEKLNFQFVKSVPKKSLFLEKGNLEQTARIARYEFLQQTAQNFSSEIILTAHTLNDQAETFLMNLIRGSGVKGLCAMSAKKSFDNQPIKVVRPLLSWAKRADTEEFCREMKVDFRIDKMNSNLRFTRVRIRRELIPLLESFNPKIVKSLANTADLLRQQLDAKTFDESQIAEDLEIKQLAILQSKELREVLKAWIKLKKGSLKSISACHLEAIEKLIKSRKSGREVELPGNLQVVKTGGKLFFENSKVEKSVCDN